MGCLDLKESWRATIMSPHSQCAVLCAPPNPLHRVKLKPGASEAELDAVLRDQIVLQPVKQLLKYQLVESDEDNYRWGWLDKVPV